MNTGTAPASFIVLTMAILALTGVSTSFAQSTDRSSREIPDESPWRFSGSIGHSSSLSWTSAQDFSYGSATGLSATGSFRREGLSARFSADATLLSGSRAREIWLSSAATAGSPSASLMIPAYPSGLSQAFDSPDSILVFEIEELSVEYGGDRLRMSGGRMPVNFGQGRAFSPADIFADFDRSGVMPRRKGVDVVVLSAFPLPLADLRLVAKPSAQSFAAGIYAARLYSFLVDSGDISLSAAAGAAWSGDEKTWIISPEMRLDTGFATLYLETAWRIPSSSTRQSISAMIGFDTSIAGALVVAEYGYYGMEADPHRVFISLSRTIGDEWSLGTSATWIPGASVFASALAFTFPDILGADLSASFSATRIPGTDTSSLSGWKPSLTLAVTRNI